MIDKDIITGKKCPYCGAVPELADSAEIYGHSYGAIFICRPCGAYVGCHTGTNKPLGRLANKELRQWKNQAHKYFDPLWQAKMKTGFSRRRARLAGYQWLAEQMEIQLELCHIGMFDVDQCKEVVRICSPYFEKN